MQISCSTAILSLFYLHLLRPQVKHLFVPGTFISTNNNDQRSSTSSKPPQQYRRDPKLEFRLFSVALVLSNKYLDDNSYSNKAWCDVTGLDLRKLNIMEQEFMRYIDYRLVVREDEYNVWLGWLESLMHSVLNGVSTSVSPAQHNNRRRASTASFVPTMDHMDVCQVTPTKAENLPPLPTPVSSRRGSVDSFSDQSRTYERTNGRRATVSSGSSNYNGQRSSNSSQRQSTIPKFLQTPKQNLVHGHDRYYAPQTTSASPLYTKNNYSSNDQFHYDPSHASRVNSNDSNLNFPPPQVPSRQFHMNMSSNEYQQYTKHNAWPPLQKFQRPPPQNSQFHSSIPRASR